jgi:hypothetical protein
MYTASDLQALLNQYRDLYWEIECLKHRLAGGSFPVESRRWKAWKIRQARKNGLREDSAARPELSNDPDYQRLLMHNEPAFPR